MDINVIPTDDFIKELKVLAKKHKSILSDIAELSVELKQNPTKGSHLGKNVYKIRMPISSTNKGKSGGARVITYVVTADGLVYLSEIYLKSDYDTVDSDLVIQQLKNSGLI